MLVNAYETPRVANCVLGCMRRDVLALHYTTCVGFETDCGARAYARRLNQLRSQLKWSSSCPDRTKKQKPQQRWGFRAGVLAMLAKLNQAKDLIGSSEVS